MQPIKSDNLSDVSHGFFTRNFGCSEGIYASLNCGYGSGDDREKVRENRKRVAAHFGLDESCLLTLYQTHSNIALAVDAPWAADAKPEADALVTTTPGLLLGILTADCAPVLLADREAGVIAAAHAGWKGAHGGIIDSTVARMEELGAHKSRIAAAIGPCIARGSYEVGPEFVERIGDARFFIPGAKPGKAFFDLPAYVHHRLQAAGIGNISVTGRDTCAGEAAFFSYRRTTLRAETAYGRQISCICL